MRTQVRVSTERVMLQIQSEPYVIYGRMGYTPVIDVINIQSGTEGYLVITASSLGTALRQIQDENETVLSGVVISVEKESSQRMSQYLVNRIS